MNAMSPERRESIEAFVERELGGDSEWGELPDVFREYAEAEWLRVTRDVMPKLAAERGWPVRFDHCFQRILLDAVCRGDWRKEIKAPAYKNASMKVLKRATVLAKKVIAGDQCLHLLNRRSLAYRGIDRKRGPRARV